MIKSLSQADFDTVTRILETLQTPESGSAFDARLFLAMRAPLIAFRGLIAPAASSTRNLSLSSLLPDDLPSLPNIDPTGGSAGTNVGGVGVFSAVLGD